MSHRRVSSRGVFLLNACVFLQIVKRFSPRLTGSGAYVTLCHGRHGGVSCSASRRLHRPAYSVTSLQASETNELTSLQTLGAAGTDNDEQQGSILIEDAAKMPRRSQFSDDVPITVLDLESTERKSDSSWELPQHRSMQDGSDRPLLRGILHLTVAVLLVPAIAACSSAILAGALPGRWWLFVLFMVGKLSSYASSATYHVYPHSSTQDENQWLKADLTAVSLAMWGPSAPFFTDAFAWNIVFLIGSVTTAVNFGISNTQVDAAASSSDNDAILGLKRARSVLLLTFFAWTVGIIGWHYGYTALWFTGVGLFLAAFAISPSVNKSFPTAPWHQLGINGWHEDFHVLLALADLALGKMCYDFTVNPAMDAHPPV